MGKVKLSEWLWRFLATVMLFAVGWSMWIFYQLNPPPLILNAAFEAAAKAKANANANTGQNAHGVISPAAGSAPATTPVPVPDPASAPAEPREPPINPDKLKFSDSIATPAPDAK
jgi:hypothetical protein